MDYRTSAEGEILSVSVIDEKENLLILASAQSSVGMVRGNNEDSVEIWALENAIIGLAADGMGGAAGGEEASRLAVETVQADFVEAVHDNADLLAFSDTEMGKKLKGLLNMANRAILKKALAHPELQGMGTTATMVLVRGLDAIFAHIGDSRAYVVDANTRNISQITEDHSFVEALVASGHLTPEQAAIHPLKNVLYRALGQKDETEEDIDIYYRRLKVGERLVLCSDGLPRHLESDDIARLALTSDAPDKIATQLINLANSRGGEDNVSVVVLVVKENVEQEGTSH